MIGHFINHALIDFCVLASESISKSTRKLKPTVQQSPYCERKLASLNPPAQEDTIREELSIENEHACKV